MHHLLAFYSSLAASSNNAKLNAVEDGQFTIANNQYLLDKQYRIMRAYALGAAVVDARIVVPSLRSITWPYIHPPDKAAAPSNDPSIMRYLGNGNRLMAAEGVSLQATTDATSGPLDAQGFLWIYPNFVQAPQGDCYVMRATASIVNAVVGTWGRGSIVLDNDLPSGQYALIGADARGANVAALRFRFPGQDLLPGIVAEQAAGEFLTDHQRFGRMGLFGTFNSVQLPTIEVYALGTTSTQTLYLDIVKVG